MSARRDKTTPFKLNRLMPLLLLSLLQLLSCDGHNGEAILSYLVNNRMIIVLKGTYATDRPLEFNEINGNQLFIDTDDELTGICEADSDDASCLPAYDELPLYIDIGAIRLSSKSSSLGSINTESRSEDFWNIASASRQIYCNRTYASQPEDDNCQQGGFELFFNGRGVIYPSRDISAGRYRHVGIFVRRIVTGWAREEGETEPLETIFDNETVEGFNIIGVASFNPGENVNDQVAQWFPLHYRAEENYLLRKDTSYLPVVLEIRSNIKENFMLHAYRQSESLERVWVIAFSDWRRDHDDNREVAEGEGEDRGVFMGGNVLTRARMFYPHRVSRLRINSGASIFTTKHYYALYFAAETDLLGENRLPYAATPVRPGDDNRLENLRAGEYVLQCRHDADDNGYPETVLSSSEPFIVNEEPTEIDLDFTCP